MQGSAFGGDWDLIDLGTLGGSESFGSAMNNLGEVVGMSRLPGDAASHVFFYSGGVMHDIGLINNGMLQFGVNDSGDCRWPVNIQRANRANGNDGTVRGICIGDQ